MWLEQAVQILSKAVNAAFPKPFSCRQLNKKLIIGSATKNTKLHCKLKLFKFQFNLFVHFRLPNVCK